MLKIEDCKPGVEVIAIKNKIAGKRPMLSIGMIYTIGGFQDHYYYNGIVRVDCPTVFINEVELAPGNSRWAYLLNQFKLRNKDELIDLFDLNNIPQSIRDEEAEKC